MSVQSLITHTESRYPQASDTPLFDRVSPMSHYRSVAAMQAPDFNVSVQVAAERLIEQGQKRAEYEERESKARFELMIRPTKLSIKDESRVADILTDVLATEGHGDMLRLLVRAGLNGDLIQIKGLCQAMVDEGAQIFADSEDRDSYTPGVTAEEKSAILAMPCMSVDHCGGAA